MRNGKSANITYVHTQNGVSDLSCPLALCWAVQDGWPVCWGGFLISLMALTLTNLHADRRPNLSRERGVVCLALKAFQQCNCFIL